MKIVSKEGIVLRLQGRWLAETEAGYPQDVYAWKTDLAQLEDRKLADLWLPHDSELLLPMGIAVRRTSFARRRIGCCTFSEQDWIKIMEARAAALRKEKRHA